MKNPKFLKNPENHFFLTLRWVCVPIFMKPHIIIFQSCWAQIFSTSYFSEFFLKFFNHHQTTNTPTDKSLVWFLFSVVYLFVCVCVCITRTGQTAGPIFMKIGTHTHLKVRKKWLKIFDKKISGLPDPFFFKKTAFFAVFQHKCWHNCARVMILVSIYRFSRTRNRMEIFWKVSDQQGCQQGCQIPYFQPKNAFFAVFQH